MGPKKKGGKGKKSTEGMDPDENPLSIDEENAFLQRQVEALKAALGTSLDDLFTLMMMQRPSGTSILVTLSDQSMTVWFYSTLLLLSIFVFVLLSALYSSFLCTPLHPPNSDARPQGRHSRGGGTPATVAACDTT